MTKQSSHDHPHDELPFPLRTAVDAILDEPTPDIDIQSLVLRKAIPAVQRTNHRRWLVRFGGWSLAGISVLVLLTIGWLAQRPKNAWAEVVDAMQKKPWVHLKSVDSEGRVRETWFSPSQQIIACRFPKLTSHENLRVGTRHELDIKTNSVFRLPIHGTDSASTLETIGQLILRGEPTIGADFSGFRIVEQDSRVVDNDLRVWREFELKLKRGPQTMTMVLRVDPVKKLPVWLEMVDMTGRKRHFDIDYPTTGPLDIYALGVSRNLKVVDRVPSGDLKAALTKLHSGFYEFDDYTAIVSFERGVPYRIIRRRGQKWRLDRCVATERVKQLTQTGQQLIEDLKGNEWWNNRLKQFDIQPVLICDGKRVYRFAPDMPDLHPARPEKGGEPTGSQRQTQPAESAPEPFDGLAPGEVVVPAPVSSGPKVIRHGGRWDLVSLWDTRDFIVEYFAYPPFRSSEDFEMSLRPAGNDGPVGTVVLEIKATDPSSIEIMIEKARYWLDPNRGYATIKHEILGFRTHDDPFDPFRHFDQTNQIREFGEFRRSPKGHWYPTLVRWKSVVEKKDTDRAKRRDVVTYFHLDFETEMPDDLFDPSKL